MILLDLIHNIALLAALAAACQVIEARWRMQRRTSRILYGLLFGAVGLVGMVTPVRLLPGVIFDGRSIVLSLGGAFGGPVVALVSALMCGAYRLWLGGAGTAMGLSVIVESAALGVAFHYWRKRAARPIGLLELWGFGLLVHGVMLGLMWLLPGGARHEVWRQLGLAIIGVYPIATMLIARLFLDYEKQRTDRTALQESEDKFKTFFERSNVGTSMTRLTGEVQVNQALCEMLGYSQAELEHRTWQSMTHPEDVELTQRFIDTLHAGKQDSARFTKRFLRKDGSVVWVDLSSTLRRDAAGLPLYLMTAMVDITDHRRAEEEKARLQAQLVQAQKLESVGRLAGGVAHDFNNMLMGILNYAEMCRDRVGPDHPIREWLTEITLDAERSANLTRQLLAFARKQIIAPEVLDINDAITNMLNLLRRLMGEDIAVDWRPGAHVRHVKMDPGQIDQILANLCINARDAIGGVGSVTIETSNVTLDHADTSANADALPGSFVLLTVTDSGCGMERETREHIFEPFFTTKGVGKGTGLGLATVYGIVRQNSGFIDVDSEPGKGTTFRVYLPRFVPAEAVQAGAEAPAEPPRGAETVLLVEDEKSVRLATRLFLEDLGYNLLVAEHPEEALRLASQHAGTIHLLITDVIMPGMSGRDLANRLSTLRPALKLLFISGFTADVIAQRGILDDGVSFLPKPFGRNQLARKVREVLDVGG